MNAVHCSSTAPEVVTESTNVSMRSRLTYWVEVEGVNWPVKQAFSYCVELDTSQFQSWDARRHFEALGFTIGSQRETSRS